MRFISDLCHNETILESWQELESLKDQGMPDYLAGLGTSLPSTVKYLTDTITIRISRPYLVYFILFFEVNYHGLQMNMNMPYPLHNFLVSISINFSNLQSPFRIIQ